MLSSRVCQARLEGAEMDVMFVLNNRHRPVITVGHPGWDIRLGDIRASYSIDGGALIRTEATSLGRIVTTEIRNPRIERRLRTARVLEWALPNGRHKVAVTGLGAALDAIAACERRHARKR